MTSATEMVQRVTKLVLPTELASIFDNRLLQHLIMWNCERTLTSCAAYSNVSHISYYDVTASTVERINLWLEQYLSDLLYSHDQVPESKLALSEFLQKVLSMAEFTRVFIADGWSGYQRFDVF